MSAQEGLVEPWVIKETPSLIYVYAGERPIARFDRLEDAQAVCALRADNATLREALAKIQDRDWAYTPPMYCQDASRIRKDVEPGNNLPYMGEFAVIARAALAGHEQPAPTMTAEQMRDVCVDWHDREARLSQAAADEWSRCIQTNADAAGWHARYSRDASTHRKAADTFRALPASPGKGAE